MMYAFCILCKDNICIHKDTFLYFFLKYQFLLTFGNLISLEFVFKHWYDWAFNIMGNQLNQQSYFHYFIILQNYTNFLGSFCFIFQILFIYFQTLGKGDRRRETSIRCLLQVRPQPGTWPATQACALTRNQTCDPLVHRLAFNPPSHTSQGIFVFQQQL